MDLRSFRDSAVISVFPASTHQALTDASLLRVNCELRRTVYATSSYFYTPPYRYWCRSTRNRETNTKIAKPTIYSNRKSHFQLSFGGLRILLPFAAGQIDQIQLGDFSILNAVFGFLRMKKPSLSGRKFLQKSFFLIMLLKTPPIQWSKWKWRDSENFRDSSSWKRLFFSTDQFPISGIRKRGIKT